MERTIRITGRGDMSVKPDVTVITLELSSVKDRYDEALEASACEVSSIKDILEGTGLKRDDLKTVSFNVDAKYETYQDEDRNYKQKFLGYEYSQSLKFEFPIDNVFLGEILYQLANSNVQPRLSIYYTIRDSEGAKTELLNKAVEDAKRKAKILSVAAGVVLGDVISIEYTRSPINFESRPMREMDCRNMAVGASRGYKIDIEPDDIDVSDDVTLIWSI